MPFNNQIRVLLGDFRLLFFILALCLYALWGSPTPDNPGMVEAVIAVLLMLSLGTSPSFIRLFYSLPQSQEKWFLAAMVFALYGFSVPFITALMHQTEITVILRDLIGFVFLCLPLFFVPFVQGNTDGQKFFLFTLIVIGVVFSARVLFPDFILWKSSLELLYLANSPLVLFTAIFLLSRAFQEIFDKVTIRRFVVCSVFLGLAAIPLLAMFVDLQRASVLALGITAVFLGLLGLIKAPVKMAAPLLVFGWLCFLAYPYVLEIIENVEIKTSQVGLNMRLQEIYAVWDNTGQSWLGILFGQGWGSSFPSPAVGGLQVTYTHSLLSYVFLKMGLAGLFLTLIYLFFIFEKLLRLYFIDPVKGNALMWPLIIPIFLYASHKSFDFGLLLSLIILSAGAPKNKTEIVA
ncbi:MAG TPA: hypothetical protein PLF01_04180 [Alphaproteobacteria bacterium]|nr:hypothetical protein [Alphaproteobacteria bacterium]